MSGLDQSKAFAHFAIRAILLSVTMNSCGCEMIFIFSLAIVEIPRKVNMNPTLKPRELKASWSSLSYLFYCLFDDIYHATVSRTLVLKDGGTSLKTRG